MILSSIWNRTDLMGLEPRGSHVWTRFSFNPSSKIVEILLPMCRQDVSSHVELVKRSIHDTFLDPEPRRSDGSRTALFSICLKSYVNFRNNNRRNIYFKVFY